MSEKEEKDIDTMIEELLKDYAGQNEALEKILKWVTNSGTSEINKNKNQLIDRTQQQKS